MLYMKGNGRLNTRSKVYRILMYVLIMMIIAGTAIYVCISKSNQVSEESTTEVEESVEFEAESVVFEAESVMSVVSTETTKTSSTTTSPTKTSTTPATDNTVDKTTEPHTEEVDGSVDMVSLGTFKLTAYCNCSTCCGQWAGGATASGAMPKAGRTIAVDTSVIPFGTKVVINGNVYVAEDTGGAIKGNKIDVFFSSHQEALNFGVQYAEVFKVVS